MFPKSDEFRDTYDDPDYKNDPGCFNVRILLQCMCVLDY